MFLKFFCGLIQHTVTSDFGLVLIRKSNDAAVGVISVDVKDPLEPWRHFDHIFDTDRGCWKGSVGGRAWVVSLPSF